jgi:hypothetical protein
MSFIQKYIWLTQQAISWLVHLKYIALVISANLILSISKSLYYGDKFHFKHVIMFAPFLFPIILLLVGALFMYSPSSNYVGQPWLQYIIGLLAIAQMIMSVYNIILMKKLRWLAISLILCQLLLSYCAAFVAYMSITGDWL